VAIKSTKLVDEARKSHGTLPTASAALVRTLTGALLLGVTLKNNDTLTLRIFGEGPLGGVIAQADAKRKVRGYVQEPKTHLPLNAKGKLDVGGAVGEGFLHITKDLGIGDPYTGSVPLVSGEIAEDITSYLVNSEQIPSVCALGVLVETDNSVRASGGFLIQVMPGAEDKIIDELEKNLQDIKPISQMIDEGLTPEEVLKQVLGDMEFKVLEKEDVFFSCLCSKERLERVLISLGKEELKSMMEEQGKAELRCHFCNKCYDFNIKDLENIYKEMEEQK